jgi:23S rRNA pseudouridine2605 synthase
MEERIQKIISAAGVASRRAAEQLILDGRVRVNGQVVTELGTKADASKDHIKVDGKLINPKQPPVYIMLNKPAGYVTTMADPEGRPTVLDLLKGLKTRVYPVGRLDYNTEGLLLLTNDGDFAHLITHPKHEFPKTYRAKVKGVLTEDQINLLEQGIYLDDGKTAPAKLKKISKEEANSWLEITIHEGRKRQVRRMFDRVGHSVIKLKRIKTGDLTLGDLAEGSYRYLSGAEVKALKDDALKTEVKMPRPAIRRKEGKETGIKKSQAAVGLSPRGEGRPMTANRREKPVERWGRRPARESGGDDARRLSPGPRVPGQGATGRGPRRASREEGSRPNRASGFSRPGTGKPSEFRESNGRTSAGRARQGSWDKGAEKARFKPRGRKTVAARMLGKTFTEGSEFQPKTQRTTGRRDSDHKPRYPYDRRVTENSKDQGSGRKPYRSRS